MPKSEQVAYVLPLIGASGIRVTPFKTTVAESSAITVTSPPLGIPETSNTSKNETTVPFCTKENSGFDGSPVSPKETQDEPGSGAAHRGCGAMVIVFPSE